MVMKARVEGSSRGRWALPHSRLQLELPPTAVVPPEHTDRPPTRPLKPRLTAAGDPLRSHAKPRRKGTCPARLLAGAGEVPYLLSSTQLYSSEGSLHPRVRQGSPYTVLSISITYHESGLLVRSTLRGYMSRYREVPTSKDQGFPAIDTGKLC